MQGCIRAPWIWMTDADACLPVDYFHRVQDLPANTAACVYPFEHAGRLWRAKRGAGCLKEG